MARKEPDADFIEQWRLKPGYNNPRFGWQSACTFIDAHIIVAWKAADIEQRQTQLQHDTKYAEDLKYQAQWNHKASEMFDQFKDASGQIHKDQKWLDFWKTLVDAEMAQPPNEVDCHFFWYAMALWETQTNGVRFQDFLEFTNYFTHRTASRRDIAAATEHTGASTYVYTQEEASNRSNFDKITQKADDSQDLALLEHKLVIGNAQHRFGW